MRILVFNGGSSSLSYKIFDWQGPHDVSLVFEGKAYRVGVQGIKSSYIENRFRGKTEKKVITIPDHGVAATLAAECIKKNNIAVDAIGHRFVHGGEYFKRSAWINRANLRKLEQCLPLAPLHNPISFRIIQEARRLFPEVPQYVVIDSAFHSTIPARAYTYPIPRKIIRRYKYRRYGFHGISYSYICHRIPEILKIPSRKLNMIVCHLGTGGASATVVQRGRSVDTSMGSSPNSGLIMSTRSGDIDAAVILHLMRTGHLRPQEVEDLLNKKSGLLGISGFSSDITDIIDRMQDKRLKARARIALEMYVQRLKKYIGSYVAVLKGRVDALVFTDDIGVNNPLIREQVCESLRWAGIVIDQRKNKKAPKDKPSFIQAPSSKVAIVTMPTKEELMICLEGGRLLGERK